MLRSERTRPGLRRAQGALAEAPRQHAARVDRMVTEPSSSARDDESPMVSAPRDLLLEVLETAESDSSAAESEHACNAQERALYAAERAKIEELRRYAE